MTAKSARVTTFLLASRERKQKRLLVPNMTSSPDPSVAGVTAPLLAGGESANQRLLFLRLNQAAMPDKLTTKETL